MKTAIYCGSFAPVRKGHIKFVRETLKSRIVDKVLIVATKDYWDKKVSIPLKHRINMLKLYETKKIEIETKLNSTTYTYELFTKYQKKHPDDELFLIIGGDNLPHFEDWYEYKKMLEYPFVIIKRKGYGKNFIKRRMKEMGKENYTILDIPTVDVSSTYIRDNLDKPELLKDKIDKKVYKYLVENLK